MTSARPAPLSQILLDRLVFAAGNLAAMPRSSAARAEVLECVRLYRAIRRADQALREVEAMKAKTRADLERLAAEADQMAAEEPGFRKDIDG